MSECTQAKDSPHYKVPNLAVNQIQSLNEFCKDLGFLCFFRKGAIFENYRYCDLYTMKCFHSMWYIMYKLVYNVWMEIGRQQVCKTVTITQLAGWRSCWHLEGAGWIQHLHLFVYSICYSSLCIYSSTLVLRVYIHCVVSFHRWVALLLRGRYCSYRE